MLLFEEYVRSLVNSKYPRTQLDVFYKKQIVLQVFNIEDVKRWDSGIKNLLNHEDGILIEVSFNKNKNNNKENFNRFKSRSDFSFFSKFKEDSNVSFFRSFSSPIEVRKVSNYLSDLVLEVYEIESSESVEFLVHAF